MGQEFQRYPDVAHRAESVDEEAQVGENREDAHGVKDSEENIEEDQGREGDGDEAPPGYFTGEGDVDKGRFEAEEGPVSEKESQSSVGELVEEDDGNDGRCQFQQQGGTEGKINGKENGIDGTDDQADEDGQQRRRAAGKGIVRDFLHVSPPFLHEAEDILPTIA